MSAPYSVDLRWRIVRACEQETESQREVAQRFQVSRPTVENILRLYRRTRDVMPRKRLHLGPPIRVNAVGGERIRQWVDAQPDLTLAELQERLAYSAGLQVSLPTMWRISKALGLCPQKKSVHATKWDTARIRLARCQYRRQIARHPAKMLKFLDESGLNIAMTRRYGRAVRGKRVHDAVPKNFGRNISILGVLACHGMEAVMTIEDAVDAIVFRAYVRHVLVPTLRAGDVVVMDNLSVEKTQEVEALITATGARLIYLPPYSPDYSPIEPCWGKLKAWLRGMNARTRDALDQALTKIIPRISNQDARGWFAHCGYSIN